MNNNITFLNDLFQHMYWADIQVWNVVKNNLIKTEKEKKLKTLLFHIHMTQYAFIKIWENEIINFRKEEEFKNLIEVEKWGIEIHKSINKYFNTLTESKLDEIIEIHWAKYFEKQLGKKPKDVTCLDTMLQVSMHSTYHRGQINKKLRELDIAPPLVDYIIWLWAGKPNAESSN